MKVSLRTQSPAGGREGLVDGRRPFGRLNLQPPTSPASVPAVAPAAVPVDLAEPQLTPIDSAKAFVGPNATFYDDRWRWMDWLGRHRSWNWAAAATFGGWFAYRRMYWHAGALALWLVFLLSLSASGSPPELLVLTQLLVMAALGLYGNTLYLLHFRRIARDIFRDHPDYGARVAALTSAGGVDRRAVWALAGAISLGAGLVFTIL